MHCMENLARYITPAIATALLKSIAELSRDSRSYFERNQVTIPAQTLSHAIRWVEHENTMNANAWLRTKKARAEHTASCEEKFKTYLQEKINNADRWNPSPVQPLIANVMNWELANVRPMAPIPDTAEPPSMMQHCMDWNRFNQCRTAQHLFTISVLYDLVRDNHQLSQIGPILELGNRHYHQLETRLAREEMALVLLEGDPLKMQTLRETIQHKYFAHNMDSSHLYSYMGHHTQSGPIANGDRLRQEIAHAVQRDLASPTPSMMDLGL